jgi:hypothetical protein
MDRGSHNIVITVKDVSGNSATANVSFKVVDLTAPAILSVPDALKAAADANCQAPVPNVLSGVVASDNCSSANELALTQNPAAGTLVDRGQHTIVVTVKDASGNSAAASVSFSVIDTTAPTILNTPAALTAAAVANCEGTVPNVLSGVVAFDNCTAAEQLVKTQSPAAGTPVGTGQHSITVTVTDASGNQSSRSIPFTVADSIAPVIHSVSATPNTLAPPNGSLVPITVCVVASDSCDPAPAKKIVSITSNESVDAGEIEITGDLTAKVAARRDGGGSGRVYTITVRVTDVSGNSSVATTTVLVPKGNGNGNNATAAARAKGMKLRGR